MNFLAHYVAAARVLACRAPSPFYVMGNALPDLLPLAAARVRLRLSMLQAAPQTAPHDDAICAGVRAHLDTDAAFHKTRAFAQAQARVGECLGAAGFADMRVRRFFLAHVLTEMALDAHLARQNPALLDVFYDAYTSANPAQVMLWTQTTTQRPLPHLTLALQRFGRSQYLRHYLADSGVAEGMNRLCLRARQDTFTGPNAPRLVHAVTEAMALMSTCAPAMLAETTDALRVLPSNFPA